MLTPGFTGSPLDRADALRKDPEAIGRALGDWRSRLLRMDGIDPVLEPDGTLSWGSLAEAKEGDALLLLGLIDGRPHFCALDYGMPEGASRSPAIFRMLDQMPFGEASTYAGARSLIDWHLRHRFCARCGSGDTMIFRAGWGRTCGQCKAEHFPRVDPVTIMLVEHEGRLLLGRQPRFPPRRFSALAGFVEPGESVEEAVAREVLEEAGVKVRDVSYIASQPWPFLSQLMLGCHAFAESAGLLPQLDRWAMEQALALMQKRRAESRPVRLFVSQSPRTLAQDGYARWLAQAVEAASLDGTSLVLDLRLDDALVHSMLLRQFCEQMVPAGVQFCLSQYRHGTDANLLLEQLPLGYLRLSADFAQQPLAQEVRDEMREVIERAHRLGLQVIGQAVEDPQAAAALWMGGIDFIQGNLVQRAEHALDFDFKNATL